MLYILSESDYRPACRQAGITKIDYTDLGTINFLDAYKIQRDYLKRIQDGILEDTIIFLEHKPCITLGRSAKYGDFIVEKDKIEKDIPVYQTDRGGGITYHGQGQLVVYPIIDLKKWKRDLGLYIQALQSVMIASLRKFGFNCYAKNGFPGLWFFGKKIGFIGIAVSKWVTYHGFSLNINPDLKNFSLFRPCGLESGAISSIYELGKTLIPAQELKREIINSFYDKFSIMA